MEWLKETEEGKVKQGVFKIPINENVTLNFKILEFQNGIVAFIGSKSAFGNLVSIDIYIDILYTYIQFSCKAKVTSPYASDVCDVVCLMGNRSSLTLELWARRVGALLIRKFPKKNEILLSITLSKEEEETLNYCKIAIKELEEAIS